MWVGKVVVWRFARLQNEGVIERCSLIVSLATALSRLLFLSGARKSGAVQFCVALSCLCADLAFTEFNRCFGDVQVLLEGMHHPRENCGSMALNATLPEYRTYCNRDGAFVAIMSLMIIMSLMSLMIIMTAVISQSPGNVRPGGGRA